jgi:putative molybdopterin biosynthesis protein
MPNATARERTREASRQGQFLDVITRDEATERFQRYLTLTPLGVERLPLGAALNRVIARTVIAGVDVPGFDRSNVDGFAIIAADSFGAMEESPRTVTLNDEVLSPGRAPNLAIKTGFATPIATGGMLPRGADAVIMIEHTELLESDELEFHNSVATLPWGRLCCVPDSCSPRARSVFSPPWG